MELKLPKNTFSLAITAILTAGIAFSQAQAQQGQTATPQRQNPCIEDIKQFCSTQEPGRPQAKCLRDNKDKLSEPCKKQIEMADKGHAMLKEKCGMDATRLCPNRKLGQGELLPCVLENIDKVSPGCKQEIDAMRSRSYTSPSGR